MVGAARLAWSRGGPALALWAAMAGPGGAECRQALVLGLDVSGSVDAAEYRLQRDGVAAALEAEEVRALLLSAPEWPVHLAVFEWAGPGWQRLLVPWTVIDGPEALDGVAAALRATERRLADPSTAVGRAMLYGAALLAERPGCARHTLDLSGDGKANAPPRPSQVREMAALGRVTVNALAVGLDAPVHDTVREAELSALVAYFEAEVIRGPGAFVEAARGYADFEEAMRRKLLREIDALSAQAPAERAGAGALALRGDEAQGPGARRARPQ